MTNFTLRSLLGIMALLASGPVAQAAFFTLPTLSQTQVDAVTKSFSADLNFRSLEGPSAPDVFGFGFGVTGIYTPADAGLQSVIGAGVPFLPAADLSFHIGVPAGFGLEVGYLPTFSFSGTSFGRLGVAAKWTFTKLLSNLLVFDAAVKLSYTGAGINYAQQISGVDVTVNYANTQWGLLGMIGKKFVVFEPYLGVGMLMHNSSITGTGSVALFPSLGTNATMSSSLLSPWIQFGLQIKLGFFTLGGEADYQYGMFSYAGKLGFKF